jgi:hypothetical protein
MSSIKERRRAAQNGEGSTRDINVSGVCVLADPSPPVGALLQLDILLPNLEDMTPGMHLYGEGRVLRCEPRGAKDTGATESILATSVQFYTKASELNLSHFESSGQVVEAKIYEQARTVRRISFGMPSLVRKKRCPSFRSLVALNMC